MKNEIRTSRRTIYGMLWELLALYEKTECFNNVPKGADEDDIRDYMDNRLLEARKEVGRLFLGKKLLWEKLLQIVDETEFFIRRYEQPGVVKRWKRINPRILFFDCAFDVTVQPCGNDCTICLWELAHKRQIVQSLKMQSGLSELRLSCCPDKELSKAGKQYSSEARGKIGRGNLRYFEERIFMDELLRTLTMVFEEDFKEYL